MSSVVAGTCSGNRTETLSKCSACLMAVEKESKMVSFISFNFLLIFISEIPRRKTRRQVSSALRLSEGYASLAIWRNRKEYSEIVSVGNWIVSSKRFRNIKVLSPKTKFLANCRNWVWLSFCSGVIFDPWIAENVWSHSIVCRNIGNCWLGVKLTSPTYSENRSQCMAKSSPFLKIGSCLEKAKRLRASETTEKELCSRVRRRWFMISSFISGRAAESSAMCSLRSLGSVKPRAFVLRLHLL